MRMVRCENKDWLVSQEAFSLYAPCMYQPTFEKYRQLMGRLADEPSARIYVCEADRKPIGMLVFSQIEGKPEIVGIAVSEKLRKQGVGTYMLRQVIKSEHLPRLFAQTDKDAVGFYQKCGFSIREIRVFYPDGSAAIRYACVLKRSPKTRRLLEPEAM